MAKHLCVIIGSGIFKNSSPAFLTTAMFRLLQVFSRIQEEWLSAILQSNGFQEKWQLSNEEIVTCQDCPYRYVCSFNADLEKREGRWHKVEHCNYDPCTDGETNAHSNTQTFAR